jgi:hypothetical protein
MKYDSFGSLRTAVTESGSHWFSPDTMRFFGTRFPAEPKLWGGRIFIASHEAPDGSFDETRTVWGVHYVSRSESGGRLQLTTATDPLSEAPTNRLVAEKIAEFVAEMDLPEVLTYESMTQVQKDVAVFRVRTETERINELNA